MKRVRLFMVVCAYMLCSVQSICQTTIWSEDFSSNSNGDATGNDNNSPAGADWTSGGCTTCPSDANDWWEVQSNLMEARDVNDEIVNLQTELIDISGYTTAQFSVLVTETGDHEGLYLNADNCTDQNNEDYADVSYRIDGGAWTKVANYLGWCGLYASCGTHTLYGDNNADGDCRTLDTDWVSANVAVTGLSGSTLEILLEARNSSGSERIQFDDIIVEGLFLLPIELIAFTGRYNGTFVELNWETASETDNNYFEVQRSVNGHDFETITTIMGAGNSSQLLTYEYGDIHFANRTSNDIVYYRLKQVDYDGQFSYSNIISVSIRQQEFEAFLLYPNPTVGSIHLEVFAEWETPLELTIYNAMGQPVKTSNFKAIKGVNTVSLPLEQLPGGVYIASLFNGYKTITQYFTKN